MTALLAAGCLCFVAALLLPAYRSTGFFSFGGPGWKVFGITMLLCGAAFVLAVKEPGEKALLLFLPGVLNLVTVALLVVGFTPARGPAVQALGAVALAGWGAVFLLLLVKSRGDLRIGSLFWGLANLSLGLHADLA